MKYTSAPIIEANGNHGTGYIDENGRTYKDPQGKERIDVGTTVFTQGGPYTLTTSGGVKTAQGVYDYMKKASDAGLGQLKAMNDENQIAIKARTAQQLARINDARRGVEQSYEDANRAAYQAYTEALNPYGAAAEKAAKLGLDNSGYSETSKLRIGNAYQNAISKNALARSEYLKELDVARRDALYNGDIESAEALSEYAKLVYEHGIETAEKLAKQETLAYNTAISRDDVLWERENQDSEIKWQRADDMWNRALQLAKMGYSNSQIASILGISMAGLNRISLKYM